MAGTVLFLVGWLLLGVAIGIVAGRLLWRNW